MVTEPISVRMPAKIMARIRQLIAEEVYDITITDYVKRAVSEQLKRDEDAKDN